MLDDGGGRAEVEFIPSCPSQLFKREVEAL
jgi:hypothetical protein